MEAQTIFLIVLTFLILMVFWMTPYGTPVGTIQAYAASSGNVPPGYLICNGESYSKSKYRSLYAVIGDTYGSDDATHFNVPDLRGRAPVGFQTGSGNVGPVGTSDGNAVINLAHDHSALTGLAIGSGATTAASRTSGAKLLSGTPTDMSAVNIRNPYLSVVYIIKC